MEKTLNERVSMLLYPESFSICKIAEGDLVENVDASFYIIMRHPREITLVCPIDRAPPNATTEGPWRCLELEGPLSFDLVGILNGVLRPLTESGIGVLAYSSFDTDFIFVKSESLDDASRAVRAAGHTIRIVGTVEERVTE